MMIASRLMAVLPLGGVYFGAAALSLALTRYDGGVAFLWVAAAILIADLSIRKSSDWPDRVIACAIASAVATGLFGLGWASSVPFAVINMMEAVTGASLLRRAHRIEAPLGSLSWLLQLIIPVGVVAPGLAAASVATIATLMGADGINLGWRVFVGHAMANLTFTPIAIVALRGGLSDFVRVMREQGQSDGLRLLALVMAVTLLVFVQDRLPLLFLPMLPLILVSFRLGYGGAAMAMVAVALIGGGMTIAGLGPVTLIDSSLGDQLQFLQFYLAAIVLTVLPVAADLENRNALNRAIRLSEERYRLLADHSTDILMHLEDDGRIRFVSPSIRQLGGYRPEALVGTDATDLISPSSIDEVRRAHRATVAARGETQQYEYLAVTLTGEERWFESHARAVIDQDGNSDGLMCIVRDISARKDREERLSVEASTDPLTGLHNRRGFATEVEDKRTAPGARREPDCIALVDIDHFKRVNDRHGHDVGDRVLVNFARLMRTVVRHSDVIGRTGGEEFAIFFPATSVEQALAICDRLRREMAVLATIAGGASIQVTVSGGVAILGDRALDPALKEADQALYQAKRGGRDQMALAA